MAFSQDSYLAFILERESIRRRRLLNQSPLTQDRVLQRFHFCNVNREHDKTTIFIREELLPKHPALVIAARWINRLETLQSLLHLPTPKNVATWPLMHLRPFLYARLTDGVTTFSNSYRNAFSVTGRITDKVQYVCEAIASASKLDLDSLRAKPFQACVENLAVLPGWGPFIAQQIALDYYGVNATNDWLYVGPGARVGLNLLANRLRHLRHRSFRGDLRMLSELRSLRNAVAPAWPYDTLTLSHVEHSLCEYVKYDKALRNQYNGRLYRRTS